MSAVGYMDCAAIGAPPVRVADDAFDEMIPILGGGTVFFIVLVSAAFFREPPNVSDAARPS